MSNNMKAKKLPLKLFSTLRKSSLFDNKLHVQDTYIKKRMLHSANGFRDFIEDIDIHLFPLLLRFGSNFEAS